MTGPEPKKRKMTIEQAIRRLEERYGMVGVAAVTYWMELESQFDITGVKP